MHAAITSVENLLAGNNVFLIPHFQRSYSWTEKQWQRLWTDLLALPEDAPARQHFIGPLVCASTPFVAGDSVNRFEVIDGQQRLSTLSALFGAIRDVAKELGDDAMAADITEQLLIHRRRSDGMRYRLVPRSDDREVWQKLVDGTSSAASDSSVIDDAWTWFRDQAMSIARREGLDALRRLRFKAGQRLAFVSISISDENPYRVFESLNTSGLALTEFDLVRNHLFMRVPIEEQQHFDETVWRPFERIWTQTAAGRKRDGWSKSATGFLRHFLMARVGHFPQGETFLQFKAWADSQGAAPSAIVERLMPAARLAADMRALETVRDSRQKGVEGADWPVEPRRQLLMQLAFCDAGAVKPLVLGLVEWRESGQIDEATLLQCLRDLVSLLVRRAVVGEKTKQYDKRFVEIARSLERPVPEHLHAAFHRLGWPSDAAFAAALASSPIYRSDSMKTRLILEELERDAAGREHVQLARLQIEHVMPQRLSGAAGREWKESLGDDWRADHDRLVHTLGNLTLTGYNQVMSNYAFAPKRDSFVKSRLALNDHFKGLRRWNVESIESRTTMLAERLCRIFPVRGTPPADAGTDDAEIGLERAGRADRNREFWQRVAGRLRAVGVDECGASPTGKAYMVVRTRFRSVRMIPWFDRRDDSIGVLASFPGDAGERLFVTVRADRFAIEERFGARVGEFQRGQRKGKASHFIVKQQGAGLGSQIGDERAVEWLSMTLLRLGDAMKPSLERAGASVRNVAGAGRLGARRRWFEELLAAARRRTPLHASLSASAGPWCSAPAGAPRVNYVYWVFKNHCRAELRLSPDDRHPDRLSKRFAWLSRHRSELDAKVPGLEWISDDRHAVCRICVEVVGGLSSPERDWPSIQGKCIDAMIALHAATHAMVESDEFAEL